MKEVLSQSRTQLFAFPGNIESQYTMDVALSPMISTGSVTLAPMMSMQQALSKRILDTNSVLYGKPANRDVDHLTEGISMSNLAVSPYTPSAISSYIDHPSTSYSTHLVIPGYTPKPRSPASPELQSTIQVVLPSMQDRMDHKIFFTLLAINFMCNFVKSMYSATYVIIWVDQFDCPDFLVSLVPIFCTITQSLVLYSYQFVDWKIFHEFPHNVFFFAMCRVVTFVLFFPGLEPPLLAFLILHWFEIVQYYSFSLSELFARQYASDDLLYVNAYSNVSIMLSTLLAGTIASILYVEGLFFIGVSGSNALLLLISLMFYIICLNRTKTDQNVPN